MNAARSKPGFEVHRWALVVLIVLVVWLTWQVSRLEGSVDEIKDSSSRTEVAANELVNFVHEIEAAPQQPSSQTQQAVKTIIDVLCASSDPVRVEACTSLTQPGG